MASERAERERALARAYQLDPSPVTSRPLLESITNYTSGVANSVAASNSRVPKPIIQGIAVNTALRQLGGNYNPEKSQVNTYLQNVLFNKVVEEVNKYQNIVRVPSSQSRNISVFQDAARQLEERLGRVADLREVAEEIGVSTREAERIRRHAERRDLLFGLAESDVAELEARPFERAWMHARAELPQPHQDLTDHFRRRRPDTEIAQEFSMRPAEVSRIRKDFGRRVDRYVAQEGYGG